VLLRYGAGGDLAIQQADNEEFKTSMYTMIQQASKKGYMIVLEALTAKVKEAGIEVKKFLSSGLETPLHCAAAGGKLKVIKFLLDQGLDVNIVCGSGTEFCISEKSLIQLNVFCSWDAPLLCSSREPIGMRGIPLGKRSIESSFGLEATRARR